MVELPPTMIYMTDPPMCDRLVKCFGCDITENLGTVRRNTEKSPEDKWKELNGIHD